MLQTRGLQVDIASVKGGDIPWDPNSTKGDFFTPTAQSFSNDGAQALIAGHVAAWSIPLLLRGPDIASMEGMPICAFFFGLGLTLCPMILALTVSPDGGAWPTGPDLALP